jgi:nucleotide-binding universal stress UspA family protein
MFNTILFAIDQSLEALHAIDEVIDVVLKYQAKLIVISVIDPKAIPLEDSGSVNELLAKTKELLANAGINAETRLVEGKPAFTICDVADEVSADLIVIGSRGDSQEQGQESISQKVINFSPCPVLVVP